MLPLGRPDAVSGTGAPRFVPPVALLMMAPLLLSVPRGVVGAVIGVLLTVPIVVAGLVRRRRAADVRDERGLDMANRDAPTRLHVEPPGAHVEWALDASTDAVLVTDLLGRIELANAKARALLGAGTRRGAVIAIDERFASALSGGAEFRRAVRGLYQDADEQGGGEISALDGGRLVAYEWASHAVRGADGSIVGRGLVLRDQTQGRELAELKREFLSTVTHELRTPLTSVKGSLQLVLGKATALPAIERELLAISLKNTDRLIRLVNDILDISQLELGKMELSFTPIAPASLVEEAIAGLRAYAAGRDIAIGGELDPDLAPIAGDRDRLIQVLTNLLSNAVKFSPTGGRILVRVTCDADELRIAVRDWGVGISPNEHGRLFQRFQRLNPGRSDEPGTGLGLAISKAIVDRHGGRITVDSEEAVGSTFTVVLPLAAPRPTSDVGAIETPAVEATRRTVLLIDDDEDFGTVLEVSLAPTYRLLRVERGVQALDVARAERPDLVLLDVVLPDLSGYDVLRILQHSEATRHIPVIMLTVQPERVLARGLGAADVVAKPVDVEELRRVVARTLRPPPAETGLRIALGPVPSRERGPLVAALEASGHAVFTATDAWGLVRCADEHDADVAVVEAVPAAAQGTVAFLRGHATTRRLPLVLLTPDLAGPVAGGCTPVEPCVADSELVRVVENTAGGARRVRGDVS